MNIFGIGLPEMAVIAAIGLLVFGPKRLPELGKTLGRTLKGFQSASRDFEQEFRRAIDTESVTTETISSETLVSAEVAATDTAASDSLASHQAVAPSAASEFPPA
jgi:sec-independent protein translocase protein TatA